VQGGWDREVQDGEARIGHGPSVAIGIFDGVKRAIVGPSDQRVEVPIVEKRVGQIVSVGETVSAMDRDTLETVNSRHQQTNLRSRLEPGAVE